MSSAKSPSAQAPRLKEPATLQTTRQMLDELDALMDRMLALPVNDIDDPVPTPRAIVRMPTAAATLTVLEPPAESEDGFTEPALPLLRESVPSYSIDVPTTTLSLDDLPLMAPPAFQAPHFEVPESEQPDFEVPTPVHGLIEPEAIPEEVIPPTVTELAVPPAKGVEPPIIELRPPRRPFASRVILPLVWFNQGFDKAIVVLGPLGRWLRGPRGRHLLGLTGLSLAAAAGIWLVKDWLGWTW